MGRSSADQNFKESRRIDGQAGQLKSREKRVLLVSRRNDWGISHEAQSTVLTS